MENNKRRVSLLTGRDITDEKHCYVMPPNSDKKFYLSISDLEENRTMTFGKFCELASKHPERGEKYEMLNKEGAEKILSPIVRHTIQRKFYPCITPAS